MNFEDCKLSFSQTLRFPLNPDKSVTTHEFDVAHHPGQGNLRPSGSLVFTPVFLSVELHREGTELGETVWVSLGTDELL